jgi:hypothetical protein
MAHYAWLDENNIVINVTVGVDETELINGLDTETFYSQATGYNIKRTSYNSKIRGAYAGPKSESLAKPISVYLTSSITDTSLARY